MPSRRAKKRAEGVWLVRKRMRELRRSRGMTQAELARRADVSVSHLPELENADIAPGIDLEDRLARAVGAATADLLSSAAPEPLPVLREQVERLFLALLVEAASKRR